MRKLKNKNKDFVTEKLKVCSKAAYGTMHKKAITGKYSIENLPGKDLQAFFQVIEESMVGVTEEYRISFLKKSLPVILKDFNT
jgi:hypothetical protein